MSVKAPCIDQNYIAARDKLIPEAEKFANKQFGKQAPGTTQAEKREYARQWSGCFHAEMNRLVQERLSIN